MTQAAGVESTQQSPALEWKIDTNKNKQTQANTKVRHQLTRAAAIKSSQQSSDNEGTDTFLIWGNLDIVKLWTEPPFPIIDSVKLCIID